MKKEMRVIIRFIKGKSIYICLLLSMFFCFIYFLKNREKFNKKTISLLLLAVIHTFAFMISCKIMYYIEYAIGHSLLKIPEIKFESGFSFFGNIYIMPIFYILIALIFRQKIGAMINFGVPAILISSFFARLNCVITGCCLGKYILGTSFRVPTRLIELLCYIGIFILLLYLNKKEKLKSAMALPIYYLIYGTVRLIEEPLRYNYALDTIHFGTIHSIIAICLGIIIYLLIRKRNNDNIVTKDTINI